MASKYIPDHHLLIRYVPWSKLRKDEDDNVLGVLGVAFQLRADEEYLSSTWVDFFGKELKQDNIADAVNAIRNSLITVGAKSGFAVTVVDSLKTTCCPPRRALRIIHEAEDDNQAHAAIRNWPREDTELLERVATDEWSELVLNRDVP